MKVPIHSGIISCTWTKPWISFNVELAKALRLKQANEDPIAVLMGVFNAKAKEGTRTAPVPIPKNPGNTPATAPMVIFAEIEPCMGDPVLS